MFSPPIHGAVVLATRVYSTNSRSLAGNGNGVIYTDPGEQEFPSGPRDSLARST